MLYGEEDDEDCCAIFFLLLPFDGAGDQDKTSKKRLTFSEAEIFVKAIEIDKTDGRENFWCSSLRPTYFV